jgi:hypothetical protein
METVMKARLFLVITTVAVVLSGCFGAGLVPDPDGGEEPVAPDVSQIDVQLMAAAASDAITSSEGPAYVYTSATSFAQGALGWFYILQDWTPDSPAAYLYLDEWPEVEWSNTGNTWCWTITATGEVDDTVTEICVTPLELHLSIEITMTTPDVQISITGTIAEDGTEGSLQLSSNGSPDTASYAWAPSANENYDWQFTSTITYFDQGLERFVKDLLTVETVTSGALGEFSYVLDEGGPDESTSGGIWGQ